MRVQRRRAVEDILIGIVVGVIIAGIITIRVLLTVKARKKPTGVELGPDEEKIAQMYARTKDVRLKGFILSSSAYDGILTLGDKRLLYSRYNGKRVSATFEPEDILSIEIGKTGLLIKTPTIVMGYRDKWGKEKTITWAVPASILVGLAPFQKSYDNAHTAESFADLLRKWKK